MATRTAHRAVRVAVFVAALAACSTPNVALGASSWAMSATGPAHAQAQVPNPPAGVAAACASPLTARTITVTWTSVAHATSFTVYQSTTSASAGYSVAATGITTTSWTSGALTYGRTYWYEITTTMGSNWRSINSAATSGRQINFRSPYCQ